MVTTTKIINPRTQEVWRYEDGSGETASMPVGFALKDSLGNRLNVLAVSPAYYGGFSEGLRPGQTKIFTIRAKGYPLDTATHLELKINKGVFGNKKSITLKIPTDKIDKI